jgi:hypothetical protein
MCSGSVQGVPYPPTEAAMLMEGSSKMKKSSCVPSGDGSSRRFASVCLFLILLAFFILSGLVELTVNHQL